MRLNRRQLFCLQLILALLIIVFTRATDHTNVTAQSELAEVTTHKNSISISWQADEVVWEATEFGMVPTIAGFSSDARPGALQLPYHSITFAIPADATLHIKKSHLQASLFNSPHSIAIAPEPSGVETDSLGEIIGGSFSPSAIQTEIVSDAIQIEEIGSMGGVRLGRAAFYPLFENDGALEFVPNADLTITFNSKLLGANGTKTKANKTIESTISSIVPNPEHAVISESTSRSSAPSPTRADALLTAAPDSMVKVTPAELDAFGVDRNQINPQTATLTHLGQKLPLLWDHDGDAQFESGESFIFYAPPFHSRWQTEAPYLLTFDGTFPSFIESRDAAAPSGAPSSQAKVKLLAEENLLYTPNCACGNLPVGWDGDRWIWKELRRPGTASATVEASLPNLDPTQPASLTVHMIGFTKLNGPIDHHVGVSLNGTELGSMKWDGKTAHSATFDIPGNLLQSSSSVSFELIDGDSAIDGVWLDALEFEYTPVNQPLSGQTKLYGDETPQSYSLPKAANDSIRVFDITDPHAPTILENLGGGTNQVTWSDSGESNKTYITVPSNTFAAIQSASPISGLPSVGSGANYVILAPDEFVGSEELADLIEHREKSGWRIVLVNTTDIYHAFGYGESSPDAIRDYLDWAYHNWLTRPEMVLLVGDGTTDPKQYQTENVSFIPPFLAQVDPWLGETAADNLFVAVDSVDHLPDMAIGRLPVNSNEELAAMVDKILRYETTKLVSRWNSNMFLVADDADEGGDFGLASTKIIDAYLDEPLNVTTQLFAIDTNDPEKIKKEVVSRWQQGVGMVMFNGHASVHQWGAEQFFHIDRVSELKNGHRLPVVFQMTCYTGSFHSTTFNVLDEQLVRQPDGGAIAVWGATGLGVATGHDPLADGAIRTIYQENNATLGHALMAGKLNLASAEPAHLDLLDTYTLLGDPATILNIAGINDPDAVDLTGQSTFLPVMNR